MVSRTVTFGLWRRSERFCLLVPLLQQGLLRRQVAPQKIKNASPASAILALSRAGSRHDCHPSIQIQSPIPEVKRAVGGDYHHGELWRNWLEWRQFQRR